MTKNYLKSIVTIFMLPLFSVHAEKGISLEQAIVLAQTNDPWLHGSRLKQKALVDRSIASSALPDPQISIGMKNLPTDTWDFDQENMTQLNVGVSQMFPRGDSLAIKSSQLAVDSTKFPLMRTDRKAKLASKVSQLWLDAFLAQKTIALIESESDLFAQMAEVTTANYANTFGKTRQQDVIRAQLEIVQLEDRLTVEKQKREMAVARLNEWLYSYDANSLDSGFNFTDQSHPIALSVSLQQPQLRLSNPSVLKASKYSRNTLAKAIAKHPALLAIDVKQKVSQKNVSLAKQQYKPQWGVNASYGYRDDAPADDTGGSHSRADFVSVGVTFDLPLFTENSQDKELAASVAETQAVKTEKLLLIKKMISGIEKEMSVLKRLSQRKNLYQEQLLKQTHDHAEASLTAYTNNVGDFSEVVRSRIAELNARISALAIDVDALKTVARINYYFAHSSTQNQFAYQNTTKPQAWGEK